MKYINEDDETP